MHKLIIREIYIVPNYNTKESLDKYNTIISKLETYHHTIRIGTDQNFDLLKVETHNATKQLLSHFLNNQMIPCITKPTRITHTSATLIDNIYVTSQHCQHIQSGIITYDLSDHLPVFVFFGQNNKKNNTHTKRTRSLNKDKIQRINDKLKTVHWETILNSTTNQDYSVFSSTLNNIIDEIAPEKVINIPKQHIRRDPWFTKGLFVSSHKLHRLYKRQLKVPKEHLKHKHYINNLQKYI